MKRPLFPHSLDYLPRPGNREIRLAPPPLLPKSRNERMNIHGAKQPSP